MSEPAPIPMILFCPDCGLQHVDAPDEARGWTNAPHRTHLCHGCGHHFRPADVPTNGVADIETRGAVEKAFDRIRGRTSVAVENEALLGLLNVPVIQDFVAGVNVEAAHQRRRWGVDHDAGKAPADWWPPGGEGPGRRDGRRPRPGQAPLHLLGRRPCQLARPRPGRRDPHAAGDRAA